MYHQHHIDNLLLYGIVLLLSAFLLLLFGLIQYLLPLTFLPLLGFTYAATLAFPVYLIEKRITPLIALFATLPYIAFALVVLLYHAPITTGQLLTASYGYTAGIALAAVLLRYFHHRKNTYYRRQQLHR